MNKDDVIQFNENHKWRGCLGIIREVKVRTITFYKTPTYKKRCKNSKKRLTMVELD